MLKSIAIKILCHLGEEEGEAEGEGDAMMAELTMEELKEIFR